MIVSALREEISSGELSPGLRLRQTDLAERFQTSTTPVREALRQLEAAGLVVGTAHRGVTVAKPNADQIASTYVILRLLEPYAARRAASRMSRAQLGHAKGLGEQFAEAWVDGDALRAWHLDEALHFTIYERCGLQTLSDEIRRLWFAFPWWAGGNIRDKSLRSPAEEHREMLDALIHGDDGRIMLLFERHVLSGFRMLEEQWGHKMAADPFQLASEDLDVLFGPGADEL